MSISQPTLEDIWALFKETDRQFKETDRQFKETGLQFKETARRFQETDLKFKETDLKFQETDRRFKETDLKFKETERIVKETSKQLGALGNRLGDFVQEMVRPAVVSLFRERGIDVHQVMRNVEAFNDQDAIEVDLLVVNQQQAVAVECKSHLNVEDINDHLERLAKFKGLFPQYQNYTLMGAVAGMVVPDDAARYAYRRGLYVLAQDGDSVSIRNDARFLPKQW